MTEERLQKYLARSGVASRRGAEDMIRAGRVRVNGAVVREMGVKVAPSDRVEVDGAEVEPERRRWVALHKPSGYVTTREDPQGRPTVYDLLPARFHTLFHVGRLDLDSEGLLLLTNEGEVANRLMHPSHQVDRVYVVDVIGVPAAATLRRLRMGVPLEDGPARAHRVEVVASQGAQGGHGAEDHARLRVTMREGRKREVRRLLDAVGHPVRRLVRVRLGPIDLGDLPAGEWRELRSEEVAALRNGLH
ncbi:MAG TPA: pseudouridine synthase [Longimicrobiales bacterium]|nr:pseudouridine synthase [Longimicrobiales bacterium]